MTGPHRGGRLVPWLVVLALLFTTEARAASVPYVAADIEVDPTRWSEAFRSVEPKHRET